MKEKVQTKIALFDRTFGRTGSVLASSLEQKQPSEYPIVLLDKERLREPDQVVRSVESNFAPIYDDVQFTSPGMKLMAETDSSLLEEWIQNPVGKRMLEIGPGTGRITLPLANNVGENGKVYAIDTAEPYLKVLTKKAAVAGVNPESLTLAVADIQTLSQEDLALFTENKPLDIAILWFGPLALMTTDPQAVLNKIASVLKPGGSALLTTNSLNGLAYREPEKRIKQGSNPNLPLGYKASIFTKRSFSDPNSSIPDGMILGNNLILPAIFYDIPKLSDMLTAAGLEIKEVKGITRLTGLFPVEKDSIDEVKKFIDVVQAIEPDAARIMKDVGGNPAKVWEIACVFDKTYAKDSGRLSQYCYSAFKAVKPNK